MDPRWTLDGGTQIMNLWGVDDLPTPHSMDHRWALDIGPRWTLDGPSMDPRWTLDGPSRGTRWTLDGGTQIMNLWGVDDLPISRIHAIIFNLHIFN